MLLILSEPTDEHVTYVEKLLRRRGAEYVVFDPADLPARAELSLEYEAAGAFRCLLRTAERTIDLDRVRAVWYRRPNPPVPPAEVTDKRIREYVAAECHTFVHSAWDTLGGRWLPGRPSFIRRAEIKTLQLRLASELGFELPPTLVTNSPADFLDFYRRHNGQVVYKLLGPSFIKYAGDEFVRFTEVVSKRDVAYAQSVRSCPVIFQAYVPKRMELRVTVVGREVFPAEIHSQQTNRTRHDWRRYDFGKTLYQEHDLPSEVRARCLQLVERLGLCYGAIDLVVTPDGRYVFLEINPNGQYLWVEYATGMPISEAICDLLLSDVPADGADDSVGTSFLGELSCPSISHPC